MPGKRKKPAAKKASSSNQRRKKTAIHRSMSITDIVAIDPRAADILAEYGLHCVGCAFNGLDTLEEGAQMHGLDDEDIDNIVSDLTEMLKTATKRPETIVVTKEAATALRKIAESEGKLGQVLEVVSDAHGFCMEFRTKTPAGAKKFTNDEVSDLPIVAVPSTLLRIGGSRIDYREGRFKLDLSKSEHRCSCSDEGCKCREN